MSGDVEELLEMLVFLCVLLNCLDVQNQVTGDGEERLSGFQGRIWLG